MAISDGSSTALRLAVVGDDGPATARHEAALAAVGGIARVAVEQAQAVAVCHWHAEQRAHACQVHLEAGRRVLSLAPPGRGLRDARQLAEAQRAGGGLLHWEAPAVGGGFVDDATALLDGIGGLTYLSLRLALPRSWWQGGRAGLLEAEAWWILPWLEEAVAPVDTVAAETRALVRREGPEEDSILAHVELADGVTAAVEAHALGEEDGPARLVLEAFGAAGAARLERDPHGDRLTGLRRQYAALRDGRPQPLFDPVRAAVACRWIDQSARLRVRVHRGDREL